MTKRRGISLLAVASAVALFFCIQTVSGNTRNKSTLTKKELKTLIANAKTKADHQKLADYYKSEAERLETEAKDHDEMAESYKKNPNPLAVKHPEQFGESHCREMARRFREAASQAESLATMHEKDALEAVE